MASNRKMKKGKFTASHNLIWGGTFKEILHEGFIIGNVGIWFELGDWNAAHIPTGQVITCGHKTRKKLLEQLEYQYSEWFDE